MKSQVRDYSSDSTSFFIFTCWMVLVGLWPPSGSIYRGLFPKLFSSSLSHLFSLPMIIFFHFPCLVHSGKSAWFVFPTGSLTFGWFYGVGSLAPHPSPIQEYQGIIVWVLTLDLSSKGDPARSYTTPSIVLRII
jgi:hypothetical protein